MAKLLLLVCLPLSLAISPTRRASTGKSDKSWVQTHVNSTAGHKQIAFWKSIRQELEKRKKTIRRVDAKTISDTHSVVNADITAARAEVHVDASARAGAKTSQFTSSSSSKASDWLNMRKELEERLKSLPKSDAAQKLTKSQIQAFQALDEMRKQHQTSLNKFEEPPHSVGNKAALGVKKDGKHILADVADFGVKHGGENALAEASVELNKNEVHTTSSTANALELSESNRREILWDSLSAFGAVLLGTPCKIAPHSMLQDASDIIYTKKAVGSAFECSLMCGVDSVKGGGGKSCEMFMFNGTAKECHFFGNPRHGRKSDSCCSAGLPCDLKDMRQDILTAYEANLQRKTQTVNSQLIQTDGDSAPAEEAFRPTKHLVDLTEGAHNVARPFVIRRDEKQQPPTLIRSCVVGLILVAAVVALTMYFEAALASMLGDRAEKYVQSFTGSIRCKYQQIVESITKSMHIVQPLTNITKNVPEAFTSLSESSKGWCASYSVGAQEKLVKLAGLIRELPNKLFSMFLRSPA